MRTSEKLVEGMAVSLESVYYWVSGHLGEKGQGHGKPHLKGIEIDNPRVGDASTSKDVCHQA